MKLIAAVDSNWGIGYEGNLLKRIPEDMKFFKENTIGKVVVMGRQTLDSLPGGNPLKGRVNIVMTKNMSLIREGIVFCSSIEDLFKEVKRYNEDDVFVIGGESIYKLLLPYCKEALITKIKETYVADKHIPDLDSLADWNLSYESQLYWCDKTAFTFNTYKNSKVK